MAKKKVTPQARAAAEAARRRRAKERVSLRTIEVRKPSSTVRPSPAAAREILFRKLHDMYWLMDKWDAPATSRRIDAMSDEQVYAAIELSENDIDRAVHTRARGSSWESSADPDKNVLWYHGGERSHQS